ncbi:MAG TPA: LAGLIDADG family homing endonuclease, partial [Anaerolineae bacterium]|nr:LAGLIDADG family homing endonuclease [Anaerolineae bacterium]
DQGPQWRRLNELRVGDWLLVQLGQQRGQLQALRQPQHGHGNQVWPKLPAILDEELAFLIGYLIGDGFVAAAADDHRVGVSVAHRSYLMTEMPALLERLFGVTLHRQQKANDRSVTLVIDNRAVKEFLQINGLSKSRSRTASVPRLIRQSPPEVIGAFLRGLFEADGSLSHGYPNLTTTSPRLVEEVSTLLIGLGCPVRIRSVIPGVSHYGKAAIYHIRIESIVGLQAWREQIGCDARSRFATCLAWESDTRRESTYVLPHPRYWLQPVLESITLEQIDARGRGMGVNFRSSQPRLRRTLLRYLCGDRQFTRSAFDDLSQAYPEFAAHAISPQDKWFVQVIGVESEGEALTLDLEVADNHTYLAYGLVTHNTRRGANMAVLPVHHPDIIDFINCKVSEDQITNFNISVGITDKFMAAVRDDKDFELIAPQNGKVQKTVRAREVFNAIVKNAYRNGEPGVLFLDAANRSNPVPHLYDLEATNPCHRGDNLVHTSLGVVPIRDLVGRQFNVVLPSGEVAEATAFPTGIKPLYRVYLDNGMIIDLTENHNLIQEDGRKVRVKELKPGTRLQLATEAIEPISPKYQFSEEEGMLLGWNAGDGWITFHANQKVQAWQVGFVFGQQDEAIAQWTAQRMAEQIGMGAPGLKPRPERGVWELATTNKDFTRYFLDDLGAVNKRQGVPESVLRGNREFQRGYLRGLFSADGYVSVKGAGKKERRQLGLVTAHEQLARKVQILLSTFGIVSRLRHSQNTLPGRDKTYERWQVTLNADQFVKFLDLIGFMPGSAKQGVAEAMLQRHWRETHSDTCGTVVKVEPLNIMEPVFNLTVNHLLHQFAVNGMISANCGEQWLGPYENCCLGSINLAQHVKQVNGEAQVDWRKLQESIVLSTHFLDNVVTANKYVPAVPQLKEAAHRARRIGLGIMGLGDLMYHAGVRYGSEASLDFAGQVME